MEKTISVVLFSLLAMTLLLSTAFSSEIGTANAQENSVIATIPPPAGNTASQSLTCINSQCQTTNCINSQCQTTVRNGGSIQGNSLSQSQSSICTNNGCQITSCINNQCQTRTDGGASSSSSTSDQQTPTNTAPPSTR